MRIIPAYYTGRWPQYPVGPYWLQSVGDGFDVCFTCETGDPITHVGFGIRQTQGESIYNFRFAFEGVDYEDVIKGDGNAAHTWDHETPPLPLPPGNQFGWIIYWTELPAAVTLVPGKSYAFTARVLGGTFDGSNRIGLTQTVATGGVPNSLWPVYTRRQSGQTPNNVFYPPSFAYRTANDVYGNPCGGTSGGPINHSGVKFVPPAPMRLNAISFPTITQNAFPAMECEAVLVENPLSGNPTVISTSSKGFQDATLTNANSFNAMSLYWTDRPELKAGREYGIVLYKTSVDGQLNMSVWTTSASDGVSGAAAYNKGLDLTRISGTSLESLSLQGGLPVMAIDVTLVKSSRRQLLSSPHLIGSFA